MVFKIPVAHILCPFAAYMYMYTYINIYMHDNLCCKSTGLILIEVTLVSFPDPITHATKESGGIGVDYWFCKLIMAIM